MGGFIKKREILWQFQDRGYKKTEPNPGICILLFVSFKRNRIFKNCYPLRYKLNIDLQQYSPFKRKGIKNFARLFSINGYEQCYPDNPVFDSYNLGKFPIKSYLKVQFGSDSTKSLVTFLLLVRWIFFLYYLKTYLYGFILSCGSN